MKRLDAHSTNAVIQTLGGTTAVARMLDCFPLVVSRWKNTGMPMRVVEFLQLALPLHPWKELTGAAPVTPHTIRNRARR